MKITYDQLRALGACASALYIFRNIFGEEVEVTPENCLKAFEAELALGWIVTKLSPRKDQYYEDVDKAKKVYDLATEKPLEDYMDTMRVTGNARKAVDEYYVTMTPARLTYKEALILAAYNALKD
jgi:hypothetical protein